MDGWMDGREPITVTRCIERKESCERLYSHSGLEVGGAQQVLKPNAQGTIMCIQAVGPRSAALSLRGARSCLLGSLRSQPNDRSLRSLIMQLVIPKPSGTLLERYISPDTQTHGQEEHTTYCVLNARRLLYR